MDFSEGAGKTVLNEIFSSDRISRQDPRVMSETGNQGHHFPVSAFVYGILFFLSWLSSRRATAAATYRISLLNVQIHDHAP
jgi:hypothetical protein